MTARAWLSETLRAGTSVLFAVLVAAVLVVFFGADVLAVSTADAAVLVLLAYLVGYLALTTVAFARARPSEIEDWADREGRGSVLQRYLLGTAPGPGVSVFIAAAALAVATLWLPGNGGTTFPHAVRISVAAGLVVVGWACVAVSFAVAFHADDLVEGRTALQFPGDGVPQWADYVYFAVAVMTTFGTTDVTVVSRQMRRTVTTNVLIAFVFNTVTVAAVVATLSNP